MKKFSAKKQSEIVNGKEIRSKKPMSKLKKRVIVWSCFGVFTLSCLTGIGIIKGMSTGEFYEFTEMFYPKTSGAVNLINGTDEWQKVDFTHLNHSDGNVTEEKKDYFEYKTMLVNKTLVNDANNSGAIEVRVLDESGNVVIEPTTVESGKSFSVEELKLNTKYRVECRNGSGKYRINLC